MNLDEFTLTNFKIQRIIGLGLFLCFSPTKCLSFFLRTKQSFSLWSWYFCLKVIFWVWKVIILLSIGGNISFNLTSNLFNFVKTHSSSPIPRFCKFVLSFINFLFLIQIVQYECSFSNIFCTLKPIHLPPNFYLCSDLQI